jgi:uncharacterized damage-inducible protein DinB
MEAFVKIFDRDLEKLKSEISSFDREENIWIIKGNISNSAGNLCLHLMGNLNHFIGSVIGSTGYVRDRAAEFQNSNISKNDMMNMLEETKALVSRTLDQLDPEKLKSVYPLKVFGEEMTYEFFLIHLATHLNYHLGQINYLRRILEL